MIVRVSVEIINRHLTNTIQKRHNYLSVCTYLLTYSMEQSPSWEVNWFAASQEIPRIFMEPEDSLPHSHVSATCPCPGPAQSSPHTHIPPPEDPS